MRRDCVWLALILFGLWLVWGLYAPLVQKHPGAQPSDASTYYELGPVRWAPPVPWREFP